MKISKLKKLIFMGALGLLLSREATFSQQPAAQEKPKDTAAEAQAPEKEKPKFSLDTTLSNYYLCKGLDFSSRKPVVKANAIASYKGITAIVFANHEFDQSKINEWDLILEYGKSIGNVYLSSGILYMTLPKNKQELAIPGNELKSATIIYATGRFDNPAITPGLRIEYVFDEKGNVKKSRGVYAEASLSKTILISDVSLTAKLALGYNDKYFRQGTGLSHIESTLTASIPLNKPGGVQLSINPTITFIKALTTQEPGLIRNAVYTGLNFTAKI
jgi:hypothetical protein